MKSAIFILCLFAVVAKVWGFFPPSAPSDVSASTNFSTMIEIKWTVVSGATGYSVYRSLSSEEWIRPLVDISANSNDSQIVYSDYTAQEYNGTNLYYWVRASNMWETSGFSLPAIGVCFNVSTNAPSTNDIPVAICSAVSAVADYDGDAKADFAVYSVTNGTWCFRFSSLEYASYTLFNFGGSNCSVVVADFDGDRRSDPTVFDVIGQKWRILLSSMEYHLFEVESK